MKYGLKKYSLVYHFMLNNFQFQKNIIKNTLILIKYLFIKVILLCEKIKLLILYLFFTSLSIIWKFQHKRNRKLIIRLMLLKFLNILLDKNYYITFQ